MNDDMQGGICYSGIAHAGPVRYQKGTWFDGANDVVRWASISALRLRDLLITLDLCYAETDDGFIVDCDCSIYTQGWGIWCTAGTLEAQFNFGLPDRFRIVPAIIGFRTANINKLVTIAAYRKDTDAGIRVNSGAWATATGLNNNISYATSLGVGIGRQAYSLSPYWTKGLIRNVRVFDGAALTITQLRAIADDPTIGTPIFYAPGHGVTATDWTDTVGGGIPTVSGSPDLAYIRGGKVIVNGQVMNHP